jgi:hypothetical protein
MKKLTLFLVLLTGLFAISASAVSAAPRLYFEPASGSYTVGDTFDVVVEIDVGEDEAMAADAIISFDSTKLKVNQVVNGDFFPGFNFNPENSNGKLTIYAFSEQTLQTKTGEGELATITFEAEANGDASVSFLCEEGNDTDSAIWDAQGNDLIDCASNGSGTYTIGGTGGATSPTPTDSAPDSPTATPSELPETGMETPLIIMGLGGIIVLLLSTVMAI